MHQEPNDPPPQEDPTHDVPVYPERDPPPGQERAIGDPGDTEDDVDEDDLDPQVPHSPPDGKKSKIVFDENQVAG